MIFYQVLQAKINGFLLLFFMFRIYCHHQYLRHYTLLHLTKIFENNETHTISFICASVEIVLSKEILVCYAQLLFKISRVMHDFRLKKQFDIITSFVLFTLVIS